MSGRFFRFAKAAAVPVTTKAGGDSSGTRSTIAGRGAGVPGAGRLRQYRTASTANNTPIASWKTSTPSRATLSLSSATSSVSHATRPIASVSAPSQPAANDRPARTGRSDISTSTMQIIGTGLNAIAIACGRTAPTTGHTLITLPWRASVRRQ
jgi:hypothetical protein